MKVIHNEPEEFITEMETDASQIERGIVRVCYERRPSTNGITTWVTLVATYVHSFEDHTGRHIRTLHELRRSLGEIWPQVNGEHDQRVQERGDRVEQQLTEAAEAAVLTVRTGRYMGGDSDD